MLEIRSVRSSRFPTAEYVVKALATLVMVLLSCFYVGIRCMTHAVSASMRLPFNINAMREPLPSMISPPKAITNASISENTTEAKVGLVNIALSVLVCLVFTARMIES